MAIEDIPHPGDTDLTKLLPPKEGERWSITRWGIQIDGVGPFPYDEPEPDAETTPVNRRAAARREARSAPGGGGAGPRRKIQ